MPAQGVNFMSFSMPFGIPEHQFFNLWTQYNAPIIYLFRETDKRQGCEILDFWFVKIISLILSWVGTKMGDVWEKPPDHPQAELGLSHIWPELGSSPQ